jgi:hypothetical protein
MTQTLNSGARQTFRRVDRDCFEATAPTQRFHRRFPIETRAQVAGTEQVGRPRRRLVRARPSGRVWPVICPSDRCNSNNWFHRRGMHAARMPMPSYRHVFEGFGGMSFADLGAVEGRSRAARDAAPVNGYGLALADERTHAYNEEAFRYFLEIERKRSELSQHPFLLLLIDLKKDAAYGDHIDGVAGKLFAALALCVRDTDFIGWYRNGRVAGAVLTQHGDAGAHDIPEVVGQRVSASLRKALPAPIADRVQVRVYQLPATARGDIHG